MLELTKQIAKINNNAPNTVFHLLHSVNITLVLKVGLTGGIACGKSHILREFHKLGVYTVDADDIAHSVILPNTPAYQTILDTFGKVILASDGTIDRKELGRIIFRDEQARQQLNEIIHPYIRQQEALITSAFEAEANPTSPIIMVDAALMVETGSHRKYDFLVVAYCRPKVQLRRLMAREGLSEGESKQRIRSQMSSLDKVQYADYTIENSGTRSATNKQVKNIFQKLITHWNDGQKQ